MSLFADDMIIYIENPEEFPIKLELRVRSAGSQDKGQHTQMGHISIRQLNTRKSRLKHNSIYNWCEEK